jgi:hypothetical protein
MIPVKTSSVFKNRWMALLWAGGILWFAYDFAGSEPAPTTNDANAEQATDVTGAPVTSDDQNKVAGILQNF